MKYLTGPLEQRLSAKIDVRGLDECWPWKGGRTKAGYGIVRFNDEFLLVHRAVWELAHKRKLGKYQCRHTCDNPPCCNLKHLKRGTNKQNSNDAIRKGRVHLGEKHGMARLTTRKVVRIRALRKEGMFCSQIAKLFHVAENTIWDIVKRRNWRHV